MDIFVNARPLSCPWMTDDMTVKEVVERILPDVESEGRALMEVAVDGEAFDPSDNDSLSTMKTGAVNRIDLLVQTHEEILGSALSDGPEILLHLETKALEGANELRVGKVREGMERLVDVLDGLEWLSTILEHLDYSGKGMEENALAMKKSELLSQIETQTTALHAAQEQQDWVGVADILEYEIQERFREGAEMFRQMKG